MYFITCYIYIYISLYVTCNLNISDYINTESYRLNLLRNRLIMFLRSIVSETSNCFQR